MVTKKTAKKKATIKSKKKVTKRKAKKKSKKKANRKTRPQEKTETNPKGAGAEEIVIDWPVVDTLCKIQCTGEEIASVLDIDYDTLQSACKREKGCKFSDYIGQKKLGGKASLRRSQWKLAKDGNATMLIWLGKNMLDQKDKSEITGPDGGPQEHVVLNKKEYAAIRKKMLKNDDC